MGIEAPPEPLTQSIPITPVFRPAPAQLSEETGELRWRRHPFLRAALRLAVVLAPAAAAVGMAILFSRSVPVPDSIPGAVAWWVFFTAATVATWLLAAELLERTLPLVTLLDLTLVFPDSVPSRFAILRRKVDREQLENDLRRLRERSDPESGPRAQLILEFAIALSVHDSRTRGHSERVRMYTDLVARELHLRASDADRLRWAALLHDIGKLAVASSILNKPERPDEGELESLRNHPIEGYRMIAPLHRWLGSWATTVRDHHERFDGTGYPQGLRGTDISLGGRIVAVTDSYETMTAGRPYRSALSANAARRELVQRSGSHFDPDVVRAFLAISLGRLWPVIGFGALIAEVPFLGPVSWRLSQLGTKTLSGAATAGATVTLLLAGVAGPGVGALLYSPATNQPLVAPAATQSNEPPAAIKTPPPAAVIPSAPSAPGSPSIASKPPSNGTSSSGGGGGAGGSGGGGGGGGGKALYPAGIAKHATLPPGIAKQSNPFAQWRKHH